MHFDLKVYNLSRNKLYYGIIIVKLATAILLLSLNTLSATSFGQRLTLNENNSKLTSVLKKIEKQVPYRFIYDRADVDKVNVDKVNLQAVDLETGLNTLLNSNGLEYRIFDDYIVVKKSTSTSLAKTVQQTTVSGIVRDLKGEPIENVTVTVKGRPGVLTNTNTSGEYRLTVPVANVTIVFQHISYGTKEIQVEGSTVMNVTLEPQSEAIDDVVVVGYGTQRRINLTGAISTIGPKEIENRPVRNIAAAMQGQMPGVTVTGHTALPGQGAPTIRIRGINTMSNASPLVVIDGVPGASMNIINPDDIESISVLKDAASSSIYGVRGANGVILITTKKGSSQNERPIIGYSGYFGLQTPTALPNFLGSVEYMELLNESRINAGQSPTYTADQIEIARNGSDLNYFANTNWIREIYKSNAPQQAHNFNVNGSANNINYYLSYGLLNEGGLLTGDNFNADRHNVRMRLNTTLMDRLSIDANIGYIQRDYSGSAEGIAQGAGPISVAHSINPLVPVRFTTGGWGYHGGQRNPIAVTTDGGTNEFSSQEVSANLQANLEIIEGLNLRGQYSLIYSNSKRNIFAKTIDYFSPLDGSLIYQTNPVNSFRSTDYLSQRQTFLALAEYEKMFQESHYLKAMVAFSREEMVGDEFWASRTNLPTQETGHIALGTENQFNNGEAYQWALQSFFGRINYAYKDRYLAEVNFRNDGSSRFISDLRWDWFWSGSAGWNFSEEPFLEFLKPVINLGKFRYSYGVQGNDLAGGGYYPFRSIISSVATQPLGNQLTVGYRQINVANRLLKWETTTKQNFGLDLELLDRRLTFTGEYFIHNTDDILLNIPLPDVIGVGTGYPPQNAGKVQNKGWELQVGWRDRISDFSYGVRGNLSDVRNKVTDYGGMAPTFGDRIRMVGEPIDAFYGYIVDRIAQEADFDYDPTTGAFTPLFPYDSQYSMMPGDLIIRDLNEDGIIDGNDRQILGSHIPRYTYGLTADFAYKGFDFSFFLQGVGKADGLLQGSARHALINDGTYPQEVHLDRWTINNPHASYPRLAYGLAYNQRLSNFWLEDASYLRLKNIQLGYTLPNSWTERFRASRVRVYASADNLFTRTNYFYGYDPETPVSSGGFYPQVKTFVFGLNVNFN